MTIFTALWIETFIENWNDSLPARASMKDAGSVRFVKIEGDGKTELVFHWDKEGRLTLPNVRGSAENMPTFKATTPVWIAFLNGEIEAKKAVMTNKIKYSGSLRFAVTYGDCFNWVPRISRLGNGVKLQGSLQ